MILILKSALKHGIDEIDILQVWNRYLAQFREREEPIKYIRIRFDTKEAYSAAGETWFGWWLVEHYLSYHVDCPDGCGLGESTRGRKDSPYFQVSYGSFDNIADLVDSFVESHLPV